jgi:hypothetical protein
MAASKTVADAFGPEVADELAKWAIDTLCSGHVPETQNASAYAAKVPWSMVHEGRRLLEGAGIDWRALQAAGVERIAEAKQRAEAFRSYEHGGASGMTTLDLRAAAQHAQNTGNASAERDLSAMIDVREARGETG